MDVKMARQAGFCFGVRRAIEMAKKAAGENSPPIFTLGPLIHNPQVVEELASEGIVPREEIGDNRQGTLIIRSHGVTPEVLEDAKEKGLTLVDATCPFVKQAQDLARCLTDDGYQVIVIGDKEHPEVIGIVGWTGNKAIVVENAEEAGQLTVFDKIGIVAQTTQPKQNFAEVLQVLKDKAPEVKAYNTICNATRERQEAAAEMAQRVDMMVVVGGTNSANTQKLARICQEQGTRTYHIETAEDLEKEWFKGVKTVGLTAGASTPDWIIEEVKGKMDEIREEIEAEIEAEVEEEVSAEVSEAVNEEVNEEAKEEVKEESNEEKNVVEAQEEADEEINAPTGDPVCVPADEGNVMEGVKVQEIRRGDMIDGTVVKVLDDEVLVDIGGKAEGVIPLRELSCCHVGIPGDLVREGDKICTCVVKDEDTDGRVVLSKRLADAEKAWVDLDRALENGEQVTGLVTEVVKGGILLDVGVRAFMPASLIEKGYVEDLQQYVGQKLEAKVIELDKGKGKVVLSRKALIEKEQAVLKEKTLASLKEGEVREGAVRRLTNFGAFVDIGGIDGLLHVSEMAWHRVKDPADVLSIGDSIKVQVLAVDRDSGKISLGLKQVMPNPWQDLENKYPVGTIIKGKVARIAPFGAFVEIEPGLDGLIPASHLSHKKVAKPEDVVSVGQEVKAKVINVDQEKGKIGLSLREADRDQDVRVYRDYLAHQEKGTGVTLGDLFGDLFKSAKEEK